VVAGHLERGPGDAELRGIGSPGQLLDGVPVAVPGREAHLTERALGGQGAVDQADSLDEGGPVEVVDLANAGHDVADGDVGGRLPAVGLCDDLGGRGPCGCQTVEQPGEAGRRLRVAVAEALQQLNGQRLRQLVRVLVEGRQGLIGAAVSDSEEAVGDLICLTSEPATPDDRLGHPAQILDEDEAQGDGDRPQLTDGERFDLLVRGDEPAQPIGIEPTVEVGDVGPYDPVHARVTGKVTPAELGQLVVVGRWEVLSNLVQLALNQVEVVHQPFGRRREQRLLPDRSGQLPVGGEEDIAVLRQSPSYWSKPPPPPAQLVTGGQAASVLLQPLDAEQLGANGLVDRIGSRASRQ
jgi:hypothetical protein